MDILIKLASLNWTLIRPCSLIKDSFQPFLNDFLLLTAVIVSVERDNVTTSSRSARVKHQDAFKLFSKEEKPNESKGWAESQALLFCSYLTFK